MGEAWLAKIGATIKEHRVKLGLSQRDLAARAGLGSENTIGNLERGVTDNPGVATLRAIADALKLPRALLGVASEDDLPSLRPDVQHMLYLISQLPEDRMQWYLDTISSDIERERQKRQTKK